METPGESVSTRNNDVQNLLSTLEDIDYMISKSTYLYLKEFERLGLLNLHLGDLRHQLRREQVLEGCPQIPTQEEIKSVEAILNGTFDKERDLI